MEHATVELAFLEMAVEDAGQDKLRELNELQLALVGGGGGDVVFA